MSSKESCTAAALATKNGYAVTAQVIMGHAAPFQLGKPVIEFIDAEMRVPKKKKPTSITGKIGEFFGSLFGTTTNEDGTVTKGCLYAIGERISNLKEKYRDFEFRNLFDKKQISVVPEGENSNEGETQIEEEQPAFEF